MRRFEEAETPRDPETQELRLALVCYGGVSLAIWMHGVTKELQKLVEASEAFDAGAERPAGGSEAVYYDVLAARATRTRVVVDIVAGTSAGGINGIVLAKALACGSSQEPVTDVWLNAGDLSKLMRSWPLRMMPWVWAKGAAWLAASLIRGLKPPLRGKFLLLKVNEALEKMDAERGAGTPVSPNNPVELHVTMTDFRGYDHAVPADSPPAITDRRHRHWLSFFAGEDQFAPAYNHRLAFAARATSSFPGAFDPVRLGDVVDVLRRPAADLDRFMDEQWRIYTLSNAHPDATQLVDGGVLDNAPFRLAIQAIQDKPAASDVRRKLVFIQPDPPLPSGDVSGDDDASFAETIWGTTNRLPRREPILDDLLDLRAFNERVDRVQAIVRAATAHETAAAAKAAAAGAERDPVDEAGFAYTSYVELKLYGVVERFAGVIARLCRFPRQSSHAAFVRAVMLEWAGAAGLLGSGDPVSSGREDFLRRFDLDYRERRLRYVIRSATQLYRGDLSEEQLNEVNELKRELYLHVRELRDAVDALAGTEVAASVRAIFADDVVAAELAKPGDAATAFLAANRQPLHDVYEAVGEHMARTLVGFSGRVEETLKRRLAALPEREAAIVRDDFDRFPYWDVLLYPIRKVSETAELDHVRVMRLSPYEATLIEPPDGRRGPGKLAGVKAAHFGAFFSRAAREQDYLWGRLDAAEWIVRLLCADDPALTPDDHAREAFRAVLGAETRLSKAGDLRAKIRRSIEAK